MLIQKYIFCSSWAGHMVGDTVTIEEEGIYEIVQVK